MKFFLFFSTLALATLSINAQDITDSTYRFTTVKDLPVTSVKNQNNTGTCWSFSTLSMFESELIRLGKGEFDLSEMFVAHKAYLLKADKYMNTNGYSHYSQGGEPNDVADVITKFGIVPQSVYTGLLTGDTIYDHTEIETASKAFLESINKQSTVSRIWKKALSGILDAYLGNIPTEFEYKGKKYTPESFAKGFGINLSDYVLLTSYSNHPWYQPFVLEISDNWSAASSYNLPLNELVEVAENAINTGYTFTWAADVSEKTYMWRKAVAIWPKKPYVYANDSLIKGDAIFPIKEIEVNDSTRLLAYEQRFTTDDHGMHVMGMAKDQNGKIFFKVKNSWGTENIQKGFIYVSEPYFKMKTMSIFIHKNAIPSVIRKKLNIK